MTNKNSFVFYYMKKSGGLQDPNLLKKIMEAFEEWMPEEKKYEPSSDCMGSDWREGWNSYRERLLENLKLEELK